MSPLVWLVAIAANGFGTGLIVRMAGMPRRKAVWAGVASAAITVGLVVALLIALLGECFVENQDPAPPLSWPWSPRREFCHEDTSAAALGVGAVLFLPLIFVTLGTLLRWKGREVAGWVSYAALLIALAVPTLYIDALPYYRLDEYPILHDPLLRPAAGPGATRVCYVHGIAHGPDQQQIYPETERICVDLAPTPEALALTPRYDGGRTIFDLDVMGKNLTQKGLPIEPGETGVDGLVVTRTYSLSDSDARVGATLVE